MDLASRITSIERRAEDERSRKNLRGYYEGLEEVVRLLSENHEEAGRLPEYLLFWPFHVSEQAYAIFGSQSSVDRLFDLRDIVPVHLRAHIREERFRNLFALGIRLREILDSENSVEVDAVIADSPVKTVSARALIKRFCASGVAHLVDGVLASGPKRRPLDCERYRQPPEFSAYFLGRGDIEGAQREYLEWLVAEIQDGYTPDVQHFRSYLFHAGCEFVSRYFRDELDYDSARRALDLIAAFYSGPDVGSIPYYVKNWIIDLDLFQSRSRTLSWEVYREASVSVEAMFTLGGASYRIDVIPDGLGVTSATSRLVTPYSRSHSALVNHVLGGIFDEVHNRYGMNLVAVLESGFRDLCDVSASWSRLCADLEISDPPAPPTASTSVPAYLEKHPRMRQMFQNIPLDYEIPMEARGLLVIEFQRLPPFVYSAVGILLPYLHRRAENLVRESQGVPRIGEGWVSETALLHRVRQAFPDEEVVHQGQPGWLRPQRFDIYLPNRNIAIEYHGLQHFEPVEYFGGEEGLLRTQQRDARKRRLCKAHDCQLIEIAWNDDTTDVVGLVRAMSVDPRNCQQSSPSSSRA